VQVKVYATLRPIVGGRVIDVPVEPGATVRDLVQCMVERWPELEEMMLEEGELSRRVHVFVDGRSSRHLPDRSATVLRAGQEIDVSPAVAGG
jgi:molybdopterin synthase sulfur carrier subunit